MSSKTTWLTDFEFQDALAHLGIVDAEAFFALADEREQGSVCKYIELDVPGTSGAFYLKSYRYPSWRKSRGLLGRGSLWGAPPCIREYRNLVWLRMQGIAAVRPVIGVATTRHGRLTRHGLLTEWVHNAPDLAARIAAQGDDILLNRTHRAQLIRRLGRCVGTMHRLRFAHRDLHARNILVEHTDNGPRVTLLDCRRGAIAPRSTTADLGSLAQELKIVLSGAECVRLATFYLGALQNETQVHLSEARAWLERRRRSLGCNE